MAGMIEIFLRQVTVGEKGLIDHEQVHVEDAPVRPEVSEQKKRNGERAEDNQHRSGPVLDQKQVLKPARHRTVATRASEKSHQNRIEIRNRADNRLAFSFTLQDALNHCGRFLGMARRSSPPHQHILLTFQAPGKSFRRKRKFYQ